MAADLSRAAAVVLAGGRGERLGGRNKALLEIGGERLVDRALRIVDRCQPRLLAVGRTGFAVEGFVAVADLPTDRPFARDLPAHLLRMAPLEAHFEGVVQKVAWHHDHVTLTGWMRHRSLDLTEHPQLELTLRSSIGDRTVVLDPEPATIPEANLWAQLPHAGCAPGGFRVEVPFAALAATSGADSDRWHLQGSLTADGITSAGGFHYRIPGTSADQPGGDHGVEAFWDPAEGFGLRPARSAPRPTTGFVVHAVELGDGEVRFRVSGASTDALAGATLGNARLRLGLVDVKADGATHLLRFDGRASEFGFPAGPAPSGTCTLVLDGHEAVVDDDLAGQLPLRLRTAELGLDVTLGPDRALRLEVVPPLAYDELGKYHQFRLHERYRRARPPVTDTVLLASYLGESCTDSQLAIDRHLAATRPDLERVWGVRDRSVRVPEGARAVLLDSAEWYDAVASSRYLCRNIDFGPWLQLRPEQAYLQTFHGYPFKSMGRNFWRSKGFPPGQVRHFASRASGEWDLILVPSEECETYYREQYGYTGAVLAASRSETMTRIGAVDVQISPKSDAKPGHFVVSGIWIYSERTHAALLGVLEKERANYAGRPIAARGPESGGVVARLRHLVSRRG